MFKMLKILYQVMIYIKLFIYIIDESTEFSTYILAENFILINFFFSVHMRNLLLFVKTALVTLVLCEIYKNTCGTFLSKKYL